MSLPQYETLELAHEPGGILRVWLNRPGKRNALNTAALDELADCYGRLQREWETRVVVLAGRGLSFCAGADRKDPPASARTRRSSGATERERRWAAQIGRRACAAIADCEAITIARVHGHAVGGGLALALCCDFRIAASDTVFHVPEVDLGIPLLWGATPKLIYEVGAARAREIILACDRFDGAAAERWNVVHKSVAPASLDGEVDALAKRMAAKPEIAVHMAKTQLRGYARIAALGDATEADADLMLGASRVGVARDSFRIPE
ncbi:MAG TPA: enoyl-CoA hydratase/isomerase family protein [Myxococcota bacterium]|nr:enoyl-CoA hydratase/isomerase family protein [Myxococcota bacterium]